MTPGWQFWLAFVGAVIVGVLGSHYAPRQVTWTFDRLGNWSGTTTPPVPGRKITNPLNGEPTDTTQTPDWFNRIAQVVESGGAGGSSTSAYVYDQAGSLVCDNEFYYQYDAWNRLLQINKKGTLTFNTQGQVTGGAPGDWLVHYVYDGLGRLIRRQTPWPEAGIAGNEIKRFEHYYYDGVRRIAETFTDPLPAGDGDGASMEEEGEAPPGPTTYTWTEREYVWGPGYVDELVCELGGGEAQTSQNAVRYALTDANYSVIALVGGQVSGGATMSGGFGGVLEQYTYDPYGSILFTDTIVTGGTTADPALPRNRVGHQGLFVDRFDAATAAQQLVPGTKVEYHSRNRPLLSWLGRFGQLDPRGTGMRVLSVLAMFGTVASSPVESFDQSDLFGDGLNIYGYAGHAPVSARDPLGLFLYPSELLGSGERASIQAQEAQRIGLLGKMLTGSIFGFFQMGGTTGAGVLTYGSMQLVFAAENAFHSSGMSAALDNFFGGGGGGGNLTVAGGFADDEPIPGFIPSVVDYITNFGRVPAGWESHPYKNLTNPKLPQTDFMGNPISYTTFDVRPLPPPGSTRGLERLVFGTDGSVWHTLDHYKSWIKLR